MSRNNWVKLSADSYAYFDSRFSDSGVKDATNGKASLGSNYSWFTLTGAITDNTLSGSDNDVFSKLGFESTTSAAALTVTVENDSVNIAGAHVQLQQTINGGSSLASGTKRFNFSNNFVITTKNNDEVVATYKLYDKDGEDSNGFELLRTDKAEAAGWELQTPANSTEATLQTNNSGFWKYRNNAIENNALLGFRIDAAADIKASDDGLPVGVSVSSLDGDNKVNQTTIYFTNPEFDTSLIVFDSDTK